jgi:hypothetical protein
MARAHGCDLRAVLAGAIICWAAAEGIAVAQDAGEVTEELGNSYLLARRTTDHGSIIETLLYEGQAIVTDIAVPTPDGGATAATTGAVAPTPDGGAALPPGFGPRFGGTWLTGEIVGDYLVLHRSRASAPVTHEIFYQGRRVGSVTEVPSSSRDVRPAGRNSFAFESTGDRFVVRLTQPDGTRIQAVAEHGRFLGQTVERPAALAAPPRSGVGVAAPLQPRPGALEPSAGRAGEPERLARPQEAPGSIIVEEPAPKVIRSPPDAVPLPRSSPLPRTRPAREAAAAGSPARSAPEAPGAPPVRRQSKTAPAGAQRPAAAAARPAAPASAATAPAPRPRPAAAVSTEPPAATAAEPVTPASAAKPKPGTATENRRPPPRAAAKPVTPAARPSRPPPSVPKSGT